MLMVLIVELLRGLCYNYIVVEKRKQKAFGCLVRKIPICLVVEKYPTICYNYIIVEREINESKSVALCVKSDTLNTCKVSLTMI